MDHCPAFDHFFGKVHRFDMGLVSYGVPSIRFDSDYQPVVPQAKAHIAFY